MNASLSLESYLKKIDHILDNQKNILSSATASCDKSFGFLLSGKRLRSILIYHSLHLASFNDKIKLGVMIELIHSASLVHDDVIDESNIRRGHATFKHLYSIPRAINIGYFMFSRLFLSILDLPACWQSHFFRTLHEMCLGELLEIEEMHNPNRTIHHYIQVLRFKTASLFALCCGLGDSATWNQKESLFGEYYGIAFQLLDDLQDLLFSNEQLGKPAKKDASMGIQTLPIMLKSNADSSFDYIEKTKLIGINYLKKAKLSTKNTFWSSEADRLIAKYNLINS